ncbi:hypothetical protein H9I48_01985 [Wolbachia pipientis]|uniref:hypothetical protein n=1 Tax=Wolbachia pipientis TaxID=955 RepID=UPI0016516C13|nr:hypothetical protein [Wolbachia pipientis]MBC6686017.1 hypothetical protein [Wolbachia pipientis]
MTTDKDQTIWKWGNTAHITKMSIEGLVAVASLAGAITAILIATKVIAGPAGIAVLFIAAIYSAAAAYVSYQQMNAMENTQGKDGAPGTIDKEALKTMIQEPEVMKIFEDKFEEKTV